MIKSLFNKVKNFSKSNIVEIGWLLDEKYKSTFIWEAPRVLKSETNPNASIKSVQQCPAVLKFENGIIEVLCPYDIHVEMKFNEQGKPTLVNKLGNKSPVVKSILDSQIVVDSRDKWRHKDRPIIQILTPYRFVTDDICMINQLPPFLDYKADRWPGCLISGRFPLHVWPRTLMWAFEWHDTNSPLILKRGEPWFYIKIDPKSFDKSIRLVEAAWTDELREYANGLDGVANNVKQTFSLFKVALKRRPEKLLHKKVRK